MDAFTAELLQRSPLASSVIEVMDHVAGPEVIEPLYKDNKGRGYEHTLAFHRFLELTRSALIVHGGNAHRCFLELEAIDQQPVDESSFYRKLGRIDPRVSMALLSSVSSKLLGLMPADAATLPSCFDGLNVLAIDGKTIKNVKRLLKQTRPYAGKLLGAKTLVAMHVRSGMAVAMHASLDGETNDVPLVPGLLSQLHEIYPSPILTILDRQFGDPVTLRRLANRAGDRFIVRIRNGLRFNSESRRETTDSLGRQVIDETGQLVSGTGKKIICVPIRRITLKRACEVAIQLATNLLEVESFSAAAILDLYRSRWPIEQVFQQVTQTFSLEHLIGSRPQAGLFQMSLCLVLYNILQLMRCYVAHGGKVKTDDVSMHHLFENTKTELSAWAHYGSVNITRQLRTADQMRERLHALLGPQWDKKRYQKQRDKRPRVRRERERVHGDKCSVQKILEGKLPRTWKRKSA